ncbi:hypothetical protein C0580_04905 [Candidatus Parcubacteria bacterium]|nr:MAG: hypothetical protein C0580_04905 [Candidatus Parcubacteria bacterium]
MRKLPTVYFCSDAWRKATNEVQRWFDIGMEREGKRFECAMYPLAALETRSSKSPLEMVGLDDIDKVVVTHVLWPHDRFKDYGPGHAGFNPGVNEHFNPMVEAMIRRYPQIEACAKMHSHTFKARSLSEGDKKCHIFNSVDWYRSKGLDTMFSFLISPNGKDFDLHCFAPDKKARIVRVKIRFVSRGHSLIKAARSAPYYRTKSGAQWCNHNKELLKGHFPVLRNNLPSFGWRRYVVKIGPSEYVICIPPRFPYQDLRLYAVDYQNGEFVYPVLDLPTWWPDSEKLADYNLLQLAQWLEKESKR